MTTYKLQWLRLESIQQPLAGMWETLKPAGRSFYGLMRPKLRCLAIRINAIFGISRTLHIRTLHLPHGEARWWQHHAVGMPGRLVRVEDKKNKILEGNVKSAGHRYTGMTEKQRLCPESKSTTQSKNL